MKRIGYIVIAAALLWAVLLGAGSDAVEPGAGAPAALLLGIGFGLLTTAGVQAGSIRGNRRIKRGEQPGTFWTVVVVYYAMAGAMALYGLLNLA